MDDDKQWISTDNGRGQSVNINNGWEQTMEEDKQWVMTEWMRTDNQGEQTKDRDIHWMKTDNGRGQTINEDKQ